MRLGQAGTARGVLGDNSGLGWGLGWAGAGVWAGLGSVVHINTPLPASK